MGVTIVFCHACGYRERATSLAAKLKKELEIDAEMKMGKPGQFAVLVGDEVVASKDDVGLLRRILGTYGFPDEDAAVAAVRARLP